MDHVMEFGPIDEGDVAATGKILGVFCEASGGDEETAGGASGGHDAVEFAHDVDADPESFPLFALNQELFISLGED